MHNKNLLEPQQLKGHLKTFGKLFERFLFGWNVARRAAADHHPGPAIDGDSSEHHLLQRVFPYVLAHAVLVPVI